MPRRVHSRPRYRLHRASGQAIVEFDKRTFYLGPHGSPESRQEYDRLIVQWEGSKKSVLGEVAAVTPTPAETTCGSLEAKIRPSLASLPIDLTPLLVPPTAEIDINELVARFLLFSETYYVKYGRHTGTHDNYKPCLQMLRDEYGHLLVSKLGPKALKVLRDKMQAKGNSRRYVNDNIARIRRLYRWAVSEELVGPEVLARLAAVDGVRVGTTGVVEHAPVQPVSDEQIDATLPHLPGIVADMVRLQRLCGCRPGEMCIVRPEDIDRTVSPWCYRPREHKTEHHGKRRVIYFGPRAQAILEKYLDRDARQFCFSPVDSELERKRQRRMKRQTPLTPSQRSKATKTSRLRAPQNRYTNDSYRRAVARACDRAFPPPQGLSSVEQKHWRSVHRWSPNQLRHAAASEICSKFALVAAKETLGHASVRTTENYVKLKNEVASDIMAQIG